MAKDHEYSAACSANLCATGYSFTTTRFRTIQDEHGICRGFEIPKRVRAWWWTAENGKLAINLRYGARAVELAKGKTAVEVGTVADMIPTLELIKKVVKARELDAQIEAASVKLLQGFGK